MISPTTDTTHTSLAQLFSQQIHGMQVQAIEIPLFQRDYAQGRTSPQVHQIRERFITSLYDALDSTKGIDLDFVFGDVVEKEHGAEKIPTLLPLDGQQRLTTLFLLHCYLAWGIPETKDIPQTWHAFSYSTRPGARDFCEYLTKCRPDMTFETVSEWLKDQTDYLPTWKHDPTIQGMLNMLDALHARYRTTSQEKWRMHWERLTDSSHPAIRFHLLPIKAKTEENTLYVKMNSRGRPLTDFENFKADLEALLRTQTVISSEARSEFAHKIDTVWTDLFWAYRDNENLQRQYQEGRSLIDDQFMRYLRFLFEVRAWWRGLPVYQGYSDLDALKALSESLLGNTTLDSHKDILRDPRTDLEWIEQAMDVWLEKSADGVRVPKAIAELFTQLFTRDPVDTTTPLRIFNFRDFGDAPVGVDLFHACSVLYGTGPWKLPHTVLFYGVLQGLMAGVPSTEFHLRLRLLRNLIEASRSEIRADSTRNNMKALLAEVDAIMAGQPLSGVKTFNQVQVRNELAKQALLEVQPSLAGTLHKLEDHEVLRGSLTAFDLSPTQDVATFINRATQFANLFNQSFQLVSAALLAKGNEGRGYDRGTGYRFTYLGAPRQRQSGLWEDHWRIRYNEQVHPSSVALMALLDDMASGLSLKEVIEAFLSSSATAKDWRYYIAKYEAMRGENLEFSGNYVIGPDHGYSVCMPKTDSCDNRSNHHDAYLLALVEAAGPEVHKQIENQSWPRCFPGNEDNLRHVKLRRSGLTIRCTENGWEFSELPSDPALRGKFDEIAIRHSLQGTLCVVPQQNGIDTVDRVEYGAAMLRDLIAAGL